MSHHKIVEVAEILCFFHFHWVQPMPKSDQVLLQSSSLASPTCIHHARKPQYVQHFTRQHTHIPQCTAHPHFYYHFFKLNLSKHRFFVEFYYVLEALTTNTNFVMRARIVLLLQQGTFLKNISSGHLTRAQFMVSKECTSQSWCVQNCRWWNCPVRKSPFVTDCSYVLQAFIIIYGH